VSNSIGSWLLRGDSNTKVSDFLFTYPNHQDPTKQILESDFVLIVAGNHLKAIYFARVYRIRQTLTQVTLHFDSLVKPMSEVLLSDVGIDVAVTDASISRLEWSVFESALKVACGISYDAMPVITGRNAKEQSYIRELLRLAVVDDLLGPADGPHEEIIDISVRDRYLVGKLAPQDTTPDAVEIESFGTSGQKDVDDPDEETESSTTQSIVPSSMGFTFCVEGNLKDIDLIVSWGRYEKMQRESEETEEGRYKRCWKRIPSGGKVQVPLHNRNITPIIIDSQCSEVFIEGSVSSILENGDKLVTLFLVNKQRLPGQRQDEAWIFQPEMIVKDREGRAVFHRRPLLGNRDFDEEHDALEMIYRERGEFAVGHGVSVHATISESSVNHATEIRTIVLPKQEIPETEAPGNAPGDRPAMKKMIESGFLDMQILADLSIPERKQELISALSVLTEDYASWIEENSKTIGTDLARYENAAKVSMDRCALILNRLREGIEVLAKDDNALHAFRFSNLAMASQRIHSIYALQKRRNEAVELNDLNIPKNRSWRPFQLAFILLSVPSLADPTHSDRTQPLNAYADLLWFPTGGGKTEAYLGVAAFAMGIRRLHGTIGGLDGSRGLTVIMRYTLRLLTLQQFQRATTLICAMEIQRKANPEIWGSEPFTIGLWVGQRVTPNTTEDSHEAIEKERDSSHYFGSATSPAQLTFCPWCGCEIKPGRDIKVDKAIGLTRIYCGDKYSHCDFSKAKSDGNGLPVLVVDEEIYHHPPTMLIATVDKFAMMAWRGQTRTLFGRASQECPRHGLLWPESECTGDHQRKGDLQATKVKDITPLRPPDLIIQDEFHLISGPLGTMVGLYETAVDELASWKVDDKIIRPKIIASTATVRKAGEQVNNVFMRRVSVFPPHGLNVADNFFSVQRHIDDKPGRLYMGVCSPGSSRPAVLIRVYVALLTAAQSLYTHFGDAADPYMTLVGYFNSLRELGGMRRLAEDDVQTRSYRVQMSEQIKRPGLCQRSVRNVEELTSRVSSRDIPKKLDQLEVKFKPEWKQGETRAIDIVLATNMLSVGIDISRIGLMVVNGQPKTTAEYIQATSRVGRFFPGLICTVLTWSRPRDLSHYETFEHYHATFYKHVEAQSVTPFAARAMDRGLSGAMISYLRLAYDSLNHNSGAQNLVNSGQEESKSGLVVFSDRAWKVKDKNAKMTIEKMAQARIDKWVKESNRPGRRLGYEAKRGQGDLAALLKKPGSSGWDSFTVPMSMREVEPGVQLVMDDAIYTSESPTWKAYVEKKEGDES